MPCLKNITFEGELFHTNFEREINFWEKYQELFLKNLLSKKERFSAALSLFKFKFRDFLSCTGNTVIF